MGYCMNQRGGKFFLPAQRIEEAFAALRQLASNAASHQNGYFAFVSTGKLVRVHDLGGYLREWRWQPMFSMEGDIVQLSFEGEKLGDDKTLLDVLAPYVTAGSYIEMQGEEGEVWRWVFDGSRCIERSATMTFLDAAVDDIIDVQTREVKSRPLLR